MDRRRAAILAGLAAVCLAAACAGATWQAVRGGAAAAESVPAADAPVAAQAPVAITDLVATPTPTASATPTWKLRSYRRVGFDRSFKADLVDELPAPPQLVVFGGSRATRFQPSWITSRTGLTAFNCAVQNCRPEDAFAFSTRLFALAPDVKLRCFFAVQTDLFADKQLHAGLLYDDRLSGAFPAELVEAQKASLGTPAVKELLGRNRYSERGLLTRNAYDIRRRSSTYSFSRILDIYITRLLSAHRWTGPVQQTRSRAYFEMTIRLFNEHGVVPAVVVMPYHPRALNAFRAVGWQKKLDRLLRYLRDARTRCSFRLLPFVTVKSFGGRSRWFYDGAHVTRENARLIFNRAVRAAPECFE